MTCDFCRYSKVKTLVSFQNSIPEITTDYSLGTLQMKNKHNKKKKLSFQQFNRMINQYLTELGRKRMRKKMELEEESDLPYLLTENDER